VAGFPTRDGVGLKGSERGLAEFSPGPPVEDECGEQICDDR
jgi:hypothetical protein